MLEFDQACGLINFGFVMSSTKTNNNIIGISG